MTATSSITLRVSPTEFILISEVERFSDGSGYKSWLSVGSGLFACSGLSFYFDELPRFTKDLAKAYDCVEGKARLGHCYEDDFIEIEVLSGGHVTVTGALHQFGPQFQELSFAFDCDQTFLPELLRTLNAVENELDGKR